MAKQKKQNNVSQKSAANGFQHKTFHQKAERPQLWNRRWLPDFQLSIMVAMAVLSLYLKTLHPSLPGGDSGELITSAHEVGVAHPPGYPLFTLAAKLVIELLPMSNVAWRVNLLNAVFSAASSGLLMLAVMRLTGEWSAALLAVALFSMTRLTWQYSVVSEVFALNNMFVALLVCMTVWFDTCRGSSKVQVARWGSLVCGLALCNQHTIVVYVACIALWVLYHLLSQQRLTLRVLLELCGCFVLGLLPYIYLPLSAYLRPGRWTWGDQTTVSGFFKHLLREEYGTFSLAKSGKATGVSGFLSFYMSHLMVEQAVIGPPLALFGLAVAWKRSRSGEGVCLCVLATMMGIYSLLFAWRSNLDMTDPLYYGVVERFWMQGNIIVAISAAVAFDEIFSHMSCLPKLSRFTRLSRPLLPCLLLILQVHRNWSPCDQSGNQVVYEFGKTIMDSMPPHAIILTKGDLSSNVLRYLHLCENHRPDLQIFDQEILTYAWSLPMLRRNFYKLRFPGDIFYKEDGLVSKNGGISFTFKSLLDHNYDRYPIFTCIQVQDYEDSWKETYELWNFGVCHKFVKKGTPLQPETWAKMTGNFAMHWSHPLDGFDPTSWEQVANAEMWNAKISTAQMLYSIAAKLGYQSESAASYLLQAYKLYMRAMDNNPEYPSYWHKNFGLVCQLLVYAPNHDLDRVALLDETVRRYEMYLEETTEKEDSSVPNINYTINALRDYRVSLLSGNQGS